LIRDGAVTAYTAAELTYVDKLLFSCNFRAALGQKLVNVPSGCGAAILAKSA
jgi:hypothetical protein